jgi:intracellular septation protein
VPVAVTGWPEKGWNPAMKQVLRHLFADFLSAVLFLITYALSGNVRIAAGIAVAVGVAQVVWLKLAGRQIEPMQWLSLGLVVVLGGATILTQSPRFVMVKPSIVHFAVATAMLRRGWMIRYITPIARQNVSETTIVLAGYAWAALMAVIGLTNLIFALHFDFVTWAWFVSVGAVGAKVAAVAVQYAVFRKIVRRRLAQSVA